MLTANHQTTWEINAFKCFLKWNLCRNLKTTFVCLSLFTKSSAALIFPLLYLPLDPPELSGTETVTLEEEEKLLLECDIRANPLVSNITWLLNGSQVDLTEGGFLETNNGFTSQLSVDFVVRSLHEGTYNCLAYSPDYGHHEKTFYVIVTDKTMKFPLIPIIAGLVVVFLTAVLAVVSRWSKIRKCCK